MTSYLIGIDNGSQSTKVTVFGEDGTVICSGREPLRPTDSPQPGVVEHPGDDLWRSIGTASRRAMAGFPGDPAAIRGVGLCTIRFCRALMRSDGKLARPVMSWMDDRVSRPYEPSDPDVAWVTTSSGYIGQRMTGQFRDTAANYQGMWPISTDRWQWLDDEEGFASFNIARENLFDLVMPGEVLGAVTAAASRHTGIPRGLPVVATANDKAVEALGSGLRSSDTLLVSLGTYVASMTTGRNNRSGETFWSNFASIPHQYLYESHGIRRGMWTVSWWRDVLGEGPRRAARRLGIGVEEYLDREAAARVPPGSDGLMVVPDWLAPAEAPFRKGSMLGFDGRHGPLHVHRAILEGIALTTRRRAGATAQELGRPCRRIVVSGGGSSSGLCMQIFADVFGLPAVRTRVGDAVGLGSAICAAVGLGVHASWDEAVDRMVGYGETFEPVEANHELYGKLSPIYDQIPCVTDGLFEQTFPIVR